MSSTPWTGTRRLSPNALTSPYTSNVPSYANMADDRQNPFDRYYGRPLSAMMFGKSFTGDYQNWIQPEAVENTLENTAPLVYRAEPESSAKTRQDQPAYQVPIEQLVKNYITDHRKKYLDQGWSRFQAGQYRRACDDFSLADAVSYDNPQARSAVKAAMFQAGLATQQYMLAISSLEWFLTPDARTEKIPDPDFLQQFREMRRHYGPQNVDDFDAHVRLLSDYARRNNATVQVLALHSVVLWGAGNQTDALFYASQVGRLLSSGKETNDQLTKWAQLYPLMLAAGGKSGALTENNQEKTAATTQVEDLSIDLPPEISGELKNELPLK